MYICIYDYMCICLKCIITYIYANLLCKPNVFDIYVFTKSRAEVLCSTELMDAMHRVMLCAFLGRHGDAVVPGEARLPPDAKEHHKPLSLE